MFSLFGFYFYTQEIPAPSLRWYENERYLSGACVMQTFVINYATLTLIKIYLEAVIQHDTYGMCICGPF